MRIVLFVIVAVTYLNAATGQNTTAVDNTTAFDPTTEMDTTTFEPTTEMGSGDDSTTTTTTTILTTTPDPCLNNCGTNKICPGNCSCEDGDIPLVKSLGGYCAEPCDYNYVWCSNGGECAPTAGSANYTCNCGANEYKAAENSCRTGKYFGGQITFTLKLEDAKKTIIEEILDDMYKNTDLFIRSEVLSMTNGSTVVDYRLIYDTNSDVTIEAIQNGYNDTTGNCTTGNWTSNNTDYMVNCTRSYDTTTKSDILCENRNPRCDSDTTKCEQRSNGILVCECNEPEHYVKATSDATKCLKIPCLSNSDCNNPFGTCIEDDNDPLMSYCDCMWGFEGASCMDPWGFVFTVLTGAFGVILIIVLTICICNTRKSKSAKEEKPEDMNLKNPFVDFQPGLVRAKVPSNMYSVSDTYDMTTRESSGRNNGAYDHAHDDSYGKQTSTFQHEYQSVDNRKSGASADYF